MHHTLRFVRMCQLLAVVLGWGFLPTLVGAPKEVWWAFKPIERPALPVVRDGQWPRNAIDAFTLSKLEQENLRPSPPAPARALIRRLYFDLIGLPPSPEQVERFVNDPQLYEQIVEELLASPSYGERWGRHWLDIARFGESDGFERNNARETLWPYRDWVIDALNRDLPYDQFARQQLASDLLVSDQDKALERFAPVGFLVAGVHNTVVGASDFMQKTARQDELEEVAAAVGQTFLGLTVHCARCHDHKFDPIPSLEYYRFISCLSGVHHGEEQYTRNDVTMEVTRTEQRIRELKEELEKSEGERGNIAKAELIRLDALLPGLRKAVRGTIYTVSGPKAEPIQVLTRGDVRQPAETVRPGGLSALTQLNPDFGLPPDAPDQERRRQLAEWITDARNPLFARVMVNRLWHYHFGRGLVETPSDFGVNGGRPTHPQLLDWLAAELMARGYSLKALHRLIVNSNTYRQSSAARPDGLARDTDNRWLWRHSPVRLDAESLRDALLLVAGKLNRTVGGSGFKDVQVAYLNGTTFYTPFDSIDSSTCRRTVYRFSPRGSRTALLDTFDCPDTSAAAPRRSSTTTPLQALALWNSTLVLRMSEELAKRVKAEAGEEVSAQIQRSYQLVYGRAATEQEKGLCLPFVREHGLAALARVLVNGNEFVLIQ